MQVIPVHGSVIREYGLIAQNEPKLVRALVRRTALALYSKGVGSHKIVKMFHMIGESMSTKTVIRIARESGIPITGTSSIYIHTQRYDWKKGMHGNKKWPFAGKIAPLFRSIAAVFVQWVIYYVKHPGASFDLSAILNGEKPP